MCLFIVPVYVHIASSGCCVSPAVLMAESPTEGQASVESPSGNTVQLAGASSLNPDFTPHRGSGRADESTNLQNTPSHGALGSTSIQEVRTEFDTLVDTQLQQLDSSAPRLPASISSNAGVSAAGLPSSQTLRSQQAFPVLAQTGGREAAPVASSQEGTPVEWRGREHAPHPASNLFPQAY